jgi:HlyD family secretion protein
MKRTTEDGQSFSGALAMFVGFLAIAMLIFGVGTWAVGARIDGAVVAPGLIVVDRNRQIVQHPDGGIVADLQATEGDTVEKGQTLMRLDPRLAASELAIVESQVFEMMARRARLDAERDGATSITFDPELLEAAEQDPRIENLVKGQRSLFEARLDSLQQSVTQIENQQIQLQNQIEGVEAQQTSLQVQLELTKGETEIQQSLLDKGLAQGSRVLNLKREDARLTGMMGEAIARRAQSSGRISELKIETLKLLSERRENAISVLRDLQISELQMRERRETLLTQLERMEITAPVSGVVYDLRVYGASSVIRPAEPLLFIVPQDRPLVIEAQINPINVSDVHINQEVILRFRSVDARSNPDLIGTVSRVSPDAFTDPSTGNAYYRAEIVLPEAELAKLPDALIPIPGMPVDTFIKTGEHSPLTYIASPLMRYFRTAMR